MPTQIVSTFQWLFITLLVLSLFLFPDSNFYSLRTPTLSFPLLTIACISFWFTFLFCSHPHPCYVMLCCAMLSCAIILTAMMSSDEDYFRQFLVQAIEAQALFAHLHYVHTMKKWNATIWVISLIAVPACIMPRDEDNNVRIWYLIWRWLPSLGARHSVKNCDALPGYSIMHPSSLCGVAIRRSIVTHWWRLSKNDVQHCRYQHCP